MARVDFQKRIERFVQKERKTIKNVYIGRVARKFSEGSKPDYEETEYYKNGNYNAVLFTFKTPWVFVSGGTKRIGRVVFSDDFRPRTRPGSLGVSARRGRVLAKGRGNRKKPIEARLFEQRAVELREPIFVKKFQEELNKRIPQEITGRVKGVRNITLKL